MRRPSKPSLFPEEPARRPGDPVPASAVLQQRRLDAGRDSVFLWDGPALRDVALEQVAAASAPWFERARAAAGPVVFRLYGGRDTFTGENLRDVPTRAVGVGEPHHSNAWGALVSRLVRDGVIVPTGRTVPSSRPTSHAHRTPEYRAGGG